MELGLVTSGDKQREPESKQTFYAFKVNFKAKLKFATVL